jgi:hypothetical protein
LRLKEKISISSLKEEAAALEKNGKPEEALSKYKEVLAIESRYGDDTTETMSCISTIENDIAQLMAIFGINNQVEGGGDDSATKKKKKRRKKKGVKSGGEERRTRRWRRRTRRRRRRMIRP